MSRWGTSWEFQLNCQFLYSIQALSNIFSNFIQIVLVYYFIFWYIVYHILLIYSYSLAQQYDDICDNQLMTREHSEQMYYDAISKCARSMKKIEHKKWPKGRSQKVCSHLVITSSQLIKNFCGFYTANDKPSHHVLNIFIDFIFKVKWWTELFPSAPTYACVN